MHIDFLILNQHLYAETAALSYSCSVFDETFFIAPETKMGVSFRFLIPKLYLYMCMHQRFFFFSLLFLNLQARTLPTRVATLSYSTFGKLHSSASIFIAYKKAKQNSTHCTM